MSDPFPTPDGHTVQVDDTVGYIDHDGETTFNMTGTVTDVVVSGEDVTIHILSPTNEPEERPLAEVTTT